MQNKLQELTDRLYQEGLSKGKEEGARLVEAAQSEAQAIIEKAKAQAAEIVEQAKADAADYKTKIEGDLKMASSQSLQFTKKEIENLVVTKIADEQVSKALTSPDFLKEIIKTVAEKFSAQESADLQMVLPAALQAQVEPFIKSELAKVVKGDVKADFSKKIAGGFTIGPKDGGYFISLTDDSFKELIGEYLRPVTKKLLFGE
jgi:V/A-type H+-transporting ATPase subunit E